MAGAAAAPVVYDLRCFELGPRWMIPADVAAEEPLAAALAPFLAADPAARVINLRLTKSAVEALINEASARADGAAEVVVEDEAEVVTPASMLEVFVKHAKSLNLHCWQWASTKERLAGEIDEIERHLHAVYKEKSLASEGVALDKLLAAIFRGDVKAVQRLTRNLGDDVVMALFAFDGGAE